MDPTKKRSSFQQIFEDEKKKVVEEMNSKVADSTKTIDSDRSFHEEELRGKGSEQSMELSRIYEDILSQILEIKSAKKEHETCSDELERMDKEILLYKSYTLFSKLDKEITDYALKPGGSGEAKDPKSVQIHPNFPISYDTFKSLIKVIRKQKENLGELTKKNESVHKRLNSTFSNKLLNSKSIILKLQSERDGMKKELSEAKKAFLFLKGEIGSLRKASMSSKEFALQIETLNLIISEKNAEIESQNAYVSSRDSVIEDYKEKVEALEKEKRELEITCRARLAQLNLTAECYKDRNEQVSFLNEKLLNDMRSIKEYLVDFDQRQKQRSDYERENYELKETLSNFKIKVDDLLIHHDELESKNNIGDSCSFDEVSSTPIKRTITQTVFRNSKSPPGWNSDHRNENSLCSPINLTKEDSVNDFEVNNNRSVQFMGGDSWDDEEANGEQRFEDCQGFWLNQIEQIVENMKEEKTKIPFQSPLPSSRSRNTPFAIHNSTFATSVKLKDFQHLKINQSI